MPHERVNINFLTDIMHLVITFHADILIIDIYYDVPLNLYDWYNIYALIIMLNCVTDFISQFCVKL